MGQIIAIAMQKGGVGKTTTTVNVAAALTELGKRVLVVDLDPQGNLTQHVGLDPEHLAPTIYEPLKKEIETGDGSLADVIYETNEGFHILPSQPELSLIEISLINTLSRERVVASLMEPLRAHFDYILIDCSPSLGLLVINALTAADGVIIPIQAEFLAARGAYMIMSTIQTIRRKRLNPTLAVTGILITMADARTVMAKDVQAAIEQQFGAGQRIFTPIVRRSIRFTESAAAGQSILTYDGRGQGAEAYRQVAQEIIAT